MPAIRKAVRRSQPDLRCPNCNRQTNFSERVEADATFGMLQYRETHLVCNACGAETDERELALRNRMAA
jgi:transcription elongation factor Elf1